MRYNIIYDLLSLSYIAMMYPPVPEKMQLFAIFYSDQSTSLYK